MSDKILTSVARKRSFPKASSNITKHLKEMEDLQRRILDDMTDNMYKL
jgi:hypothetical protein